VSGRALLVALIPCYNPGPALAAVVATASKHVEALVVVDDGSEQGLEEALGATPVTRLRFERNRGKGHALVAGLRLCLAQFPCDAVVMLDADGQHDADEIPALRRVWAQSRADLVIGVRTGDWTRVAVSRRWGNRVGSRVLSRVCGQPIPDSQCGFRLLSRPALEAILPVLPGGRYETESVMLILAARRGFRIASVPVRLIPARAPSTSHFRLLRDSIRVGLALARHGVGGAGRP